MKNITILGLKELISDWKKHAERYAEPVDDEKMKAVNLGLRQGLLHCANELDLMIGDNLRIDMIAPIPYAE